VTIHARGEAWPDSRSRGLLRLQHRIPYHLAMELVLTGRMWPATEAADVHLVNRLADPGDAPTVALGLAEDVATNAPLALAASKQVLVRSTTGRSRRSSTGSRSTSTRASTLTYLQCNAPYHGS
jgi:enoyl-CoA hydratase/carnithine racemase